MRADCRKGKKCSAIASGREENVERNSPVDTQVSEGRRGGSPGIKAEIPWQGVERTMVEPAVPLQPKEDNVGAYMHAPACG